MERIMRPDRFDADPSSSEATKEWKHWHRTFTNYLVSIAYHEPNKLSLLVNYLTPHIYDYISECTTYDSAIETLTALYVKPKNEIFARHLLASRRQKPGESLDEFLQALKSLAPDCNFTAVSAEKHKEEYIRDAFINGIRSQRVRQRLLENEKLDLQTAFNQACSADAAQQSPESYSAPFTAAAALSHSEAAAASPGDPLRITTGDLERQIEIMEETVDTAAASSSVDDDPLRITPEDLVMQIETKEETVDAAQPSTSADGGSMLRCSHCDYASLSQGQLDTHVKQRHGYIGRDFKHKCEWCEYSSNYAANLVNHRLTHTGERPHRCAECGKTFSLSNALKNHCLIHTGQRPYSCDVCGKAFKQPGNLTVHRRIHTGEKVRQCEQCGATFNVVSHYTKHMRSHSGVKAYRCQECSARFVTRQELTLHVRTHTGERPYGCSFCPARFTTQSNRKVHVTRRHTHDYQHRCGRCGKGFCAKRHLRKHATRCSVSS